VHLDISQLQAPVFAANVQQGPTQTKEPLNADALQGWRKTLKIFLGAPASSVPCEELFSGAVDLVAPIGVPRVQSLSVRRCCLKIGTEITISK
jgi:hypothetical protein